MTCVFCAIVRGEAPSAIVHRDDHACAFLDVKPLFKGHVLVVPTQHVVTLAELPPDELAPFFAVVQRLSRALPHALSAEGTFVAANNAVSQSVPHLHVHVVPRKKGDGLRGFFWPRGTYASNEELADFARRIADAL